jgi:hypothetical protein
VEEIVKLDKLIATLEKKRRAKREEQAQIETLKKNVFQGMGAKAAFGLGQDVERVRSQKRQKLS